MFSKVKYIVVIAGLITLLNACQKTRVQSFGQYCQWINDPAKGVCKEKFINGIQLKLKYMPPAFQVYRELKSMEKYSEEEKNNLTRSYANSLTFVLSLGPDEREKSAVDIMYKNLSTYKEYAERVNEINFQMEQFLTLEAGRVEYKPVLTSMDGVQGLSNTKSIMIVFSPKDANDKNLLSAKQFTLTYDDDMFGLGTNH